MSFLNLADKVLLRYGRAKVGSATLNSQPGAHTGNSRQYIPGYSDSNIIFRAPTTGNDANDGLTEGAPKQTKAACDTAAGTTKKIRIIEACSLNESVSKPTEMKRGVSGTISSSLTAPVATWTQSTTLNGFTGTQGGIVWAPWLSKFVAVGGTSKIYTSSDGNTFTAVSTHSFGADNPLFIVADTKRKILYAAGEAGKIASSTDGNVFTQVTTGTATSITALSVNETNGAVVFAAGSRVFYTLDEFATVEEAPSFTVNNVTLIVNNGSKYLFTDNQDYGYTSTDLQNVTITNQIGATAAPRAGMYSAILSKFILGDENGDIFTSADGLTWATAATPAFTGGGAFGFAESLEIGRVVSAGAGGEIVYSSDGNAWTLAATPSFGATDIYSAAYSPLTGKFCLAGIAKAAYSTAFANTISANVAGFTIQAVQYSGTITAYNCTMKQPGTTANLSLNACRVTEPGAHISTNAQAHIATLFEGDAHFTSAPASANAFALNLNTFLESVYLYNSSATGYEQIRDNIIVGDMRANYAVTMLSGNIQGTRENIITNRGVSYSLPVFGTDSALSRKTLGDAQDSPLCNKAGYYTNEQGEPRDLGAWSYDDSELAYGYLYSAYLNKPAGQGIRPQKVPAASADQGLDGTWDAVNEPERATEWLTLSYQSGVPQDHIVAVNLLESLTDMTCDISLAPDLSDPSTAIVVNGNHPIGDIVLNIDASTTIRAGMIIEISSVKYYILYVSPSTSATKIVLHKPLESAVSDNASITPEEPTADGTYQYVPQMRENPRPYSHETEYVNGLILKFVRQYPQL